MPPIPPPVKFRAEEVWYNGQLLSEVLDSLVSGDVHGSGAVSQVSYWSSTNTVAGSSDFTWDNVDKILAINGSITADDLTLSSPLAVASGGTGTTDLSTIASSILPTQTGNNGKVLGTDGSTISWVSQTPAATWGGIAGTLSDQTDLNSALSGKEPTIASGTTGQYWRGDKTWQTLPDINALVPTQTGNTGKFLKTDGSVVSWENPADIAATWGSITGTLSSQTDLQTALNAKQDSLPTQSGQNGKFLMTNGTTVSWSTPADVVAVWGGITGTLANQTDLQSALNAKQDSLPSQSGNSGKFLTTNGSTVSWGSQSTATVDAAGLMPAVAFQQYSMSPGTDNTAAIDTTGASGTYSELQVTNVASSIDSIANLAYKRCHDTGHAAVNKLIPVLLFPGFTSDGLTEFPDSMARRMAGYVGTATGRSPLVIKLRTRGRGNSGTIDHARDTQDAVDLLDHAVSAVNALGNYVYGTSAICIGYSTGALDALLFATKFPDRCLGVIMYYPNYDLGLDPVDSYYMLQVPIHRATIASELQPGGDVRLSGGASAVDQYMVRNAIDGIARIMAIPGGPHVWLIGDTNDPEILPTRERLRDALQALPGSKAKAHIHITATGDSNRVLHAGGDNSAAAIYSERYYFPFLLDNAAEWTMPKKSPAGNLRLLGFMKTRLFEIWTGPNTAPKTTVGAGGKDHAGEFKYDDYSRQYTFIPETTTSGYLQVLRGYDNRSDQFSASSQYLMNLNVSKVITSVTDIGIQFSWRSDLGVTDSSGVTNWVDQIGGLAFTASTNKPSYTTDSNGKNFISFLGSSSQKLSLNQLLFSLTSDFTVFIVATRTSSGVGALFEAAHHGTYARIGIGLSSGSSVSGYAFQDVGNSWAVANSNGVGGQAAIQNNIHVFALMRKNGYLYTSIDGSYWSYSAFISSAFTQTGTNITTLGCGWADGGGAYWQFWTGGIYEVDVKASATSEVDVFSHYALMRSRWQF